MNKLRVGIILPDMKAPIWVVRMIEQIQHSTYGEVVAAAFVGETHAESSFANRLYKLHTQLDLKLFHPTPNPWEQNDIRPLLPNTQILAKDLNQQIARLKAQRLDVLVNLSLQDIPESVMDAVRLGAWSLRNGTARITTETQFGWYELFRGESMMRCVIESQHGTSLQMIAESSLPTDPRSFTNNQKSFLWRASSLIPRTLKYLYLQGENNFFWRAKPVSSSTKTSSPTSAQIITGAVKQGFKITRNKILRPWRQEQWTLMARIGSMEDTLNWNGFKPIVPPRSAFWADPFIFERQGKTYIFFEEFVYKTGLGRIACIEVQQNGEATQPKAVLEKPYHLSYPFMFEYRGELYMIPETAQNRAIEMYRCTRFPDQWQLHKTLMQNLRAVDTTLLEYAGVWWMFVNIAGEGGSTWDELHLFHSDDPLSTNWTPHPLNPIVSDIHTARPAGRIFRRDGKLIRPSQDSSLRYGYALNLNHITKLTKTEYEEELLERLEPPPAGNIFAVHTYNFSGNLTVIDVMLKNRR